MSVTKTKKNIRNNALLESKVKQALYEPKLPDTRLLIIFISLK